MRINVPSEPGSAVSSMGWFSEFNISVWLGGGSDPEASPRLSTLDKSVASAIARVMPIERANVIP